VGFKFSLGDRFIGRFWADKLDLPANDVKPFNFRGYIVEPDLDAVGSLVSIYLNGDTHTLKVKAESVVPPVAWLSDALGKHVLGVGFPGKEHKVITSIELSGLAITKDPQHVSSGRITIAYQNPFEFPIKVIRASAAVKLEYNGKIAAKFTLKETDVDSASSSVAGRPGEVQIKFEEQVLAVLEQETFKAWRTAAAGSKTKVKLSGEATVVVNTDIGDVTLTDLRFGGLSSELQVVA